MIAQNETEEEVFQFILNILEGYLFGRSKLPIEEMLKLLFPSNGKSGRS